MRLDTIPPRFQERIAKLKSRHKKRSNASTWRQQDESEEEAEENLETGADKPRRARSGHRGGEHSFVRGSSSARGGRGRGRGRGGRGGRGDRSNANGDAEASGHLESLAAGLPSGHGGYLTAGQVFSSPQPMAAQALVASLSPSSPALSQHHGVVTPAVPYLSGAVPAFSIGASHVPIAPQGYGGRPIHFTSPQQFGSPPQYQQLQLVPQHMSGPVSPGPVTVSPFGNLSPVHGAAPPPSAMLGLMPQHPQHSLPRGGPSRGGRRPSRGGGHGSRNRNRKG